jgi:hypothetical protein
MSKDEMSGASDPSSFEYNLSRLRVTNDRPDLMLIGRGLQFDAVGATVTEYGTLGKILRPSRMKVIRDVVSDDQMADSERMFRKIMANPTIVNRFDSLKKPVFDDAVELLRRQCREVVPYTDKIRGVSCYQRVRISGNAALTGLAVTATWSKQLQAIWFSSIGTGYQYMPWQKLFRPNDRALRSLLYEFRSDYVCMLLMLDDFGSSPELLRQLGIV